MATSKIIHDKIKTKTFTGTTNGQGALPLATAIPKTDTNLAIACTSEINALCTPWLYNNATWYAKIERWMDRQIYANQEVTLLIRYLVGGEVIRRKITQALQPGREVA